MNTKWPTYPKFQNFQNSIKTKFQLYQHIQHDEGMKIDVLLVAVHGRKCRKTRRNPPENQEAWELRFSPNLDRFEHLRPYTSSPHQEEAIGTGFVRRRGRNRKSPSELPLLLSSDSLSSGVAITSRGHH